MAKKYIDAERLIEYLEKEADKEFKATEENANSPVICHFHNGCRMQALDTIDFIKQLQQEQSCDTCTNDKGCVTCKDGELWEGKEQPCEDLEEAAKQYHERIQFSSRPSFYDAFIAGAEWQKEQMGEQARKELAKTDITLADLVAFDEGCKIGRRLERQDILRGAVEGEVIEDLHGQRYVKSEAVDGTKFNFGDKVKIVIVPDKEGKK